MRLIDTHAHLNDPRFAPDLRQVLERARQAGLVAIITVGYDLDSSRLAVDLAERHPDVYAALGVHPHDAKTVTPKALAALRQLAGNQRVVALGETGLDFYRDLSPRDAQKRVFGDFIALAGELRLPLIVHSRDASEETLSVLDEHRAPEQSVIMHCFSGGPAFAEECLRRGFYLGIAGPVTYPKSNVLRQIVRAAPPDRLLVETDCPWLPPQSHRGKRNEPAYVALVAERVAAERGMTYEELAALTTVNARAAFGLPV